MQLVTSTNCTRDGGHIRLSSSRTRTGLRHTVLQTVPSDLLRTVLCTLLVVTVLMLPSGSEPNKFSSVCAKYGMAENTSFYGAVPYPVAYGLVDLVAPPTETQPVT